MKSGIIEAIDGKEQVAFERSSLEAYDQKTEASVGVQVAG